MMKLVNTTIDRDFLVKAAEGNKDWSKKLVRFGNLTLVENDPGNYDIEFWLDYFKRTHTDCITLSAGGIVAYYPTQVPFHYTGAWMGNSDPFGDLMVGCRKLGMNIIARTDPHAVHQDAYDAHPEWIAVDSKGNKRRHWANPELWVACTLGPYAFEYMNEIHKEIMYNYMPDAIFSNRWEGSGLCYCESCRSSFESEYGIALPLAVNIQDEAYRKYLAWFERRLLQLWQHWDADVQSINPNGRFNPNMGIAQHYISMKTIGERANTLNVDKQGRSHNLEAIWCMSRVGKQFHSVMGRKPVAGGLSVGPEVKYRWKDAVQSEAELRICYADGMAGGMHPSWGKFSGVLYDTRWLKVVEDVFNWHHKWEKYFINEESMANIALVYTQRKPWRTEGVNPNYNLADHELGMYHALVEARVPFDLVHEQLLNLENISRYKLLILSNTACMSEAQCSVLKQYVQQGGSVLATYETSLYNELGHKRENFGLAEVFGVNYKITKPGPIRNSYLRFEEDPLSGKRHPIIQGFDGAQRIIHGVWQMEVEAVDKFPNPPVTLIPSYPDLPMEDVYPRQPKTDIPEIYMREKGESRIVFFPWDIDRVFWEIMCVDHGRLIGNAVKWAAKEELPVAVTGAGVIDIALWKQKDSMTIHLVNLSNPMMLKGSCRELIPISVQNVRVKLPQGYSASKVQFLVAEQEASYIMDGNYMEIVVPTILHHEVIAIDLAVI